MGEPRDGAAALAAALDGSSHHSPPDGAPPLSRAQFHEDQAVRDIT